MTQKENKYPKKRYVLYDGRARMGDTDEAVVFETTDKMPTSTPKVYGNDAIWGELELVDENGHLFYRDVGLLWEIAN